MGIHLPDWDDYQALLNRVEALEAALAARPEQREWLTIPAAAKYLGRSEDAIRKLIDRLDVDKHQELPGGRITLSRDELDAALANHNAKSQG